MDARTHVRRIMVGNKKKLEHFLLTPYNKI